jgi:hypothetical protein
MVLHTHRPLFLAVPPILSTGYEPGNGDTEYRPNRPTFRANITHVISNDAIATDYNDENASKWTIDSASNAHLTPFKFSIRNYLPFVQPSKGIGIGGKSVLALGYGSVTLTDEYGGKYTVKDIMYVPDSDMSILSLMGLQEQGLRFAFTDNAPTPGPFTITSQRYNFSLTGTAVDRILFAREYSEIQQARTLAV